MRKITINADTLIMYRSKKEYWSTNKDIIGYDNYDDYVADYQKGFINFPKYEIDGFCCENKSDLIQYLHYYKPNFLKFVIRNEN